VNCICPGAIDTPLLRPSLSIPGFAEETTRMIPMRRLGRPEEMAAVVMFLACDLASYVTGTAVVADGGLTVLRRRRNGQGVGEGEGVESASASAARAASAMSAGIGSLRRPIRVIPRLPRRLAA
jgi:Enoyl-(Acyl carrier protein) reductase